jgi:hypothetical protein
VRKYSKCNDYSNGVTCNAVTAIVCVKPISQLTRYY